MTSSQPAFVAYKFLKLLPKALLEKQNIEITSDADIINTLRSAYGIELKEEGSLEAIKNMYKTEQQTNMYIKMLYPDQIPLKNLNT